jgi:hypothetical protein
MNEEVINLTSARYEKVGKDFVFEEGHVFTFHMGKREITMADFDKTYFGKVKSVDGRYMVIEFSSEPLVDQGGVQLKTFDIGLTLKRNGFVNSKLLSKSGVGEFEFPLFDVVNVDGAIIIETILVMGEKDEIPPREP